MMKPTLQTLLASIMAASIGMVLLGCKSLDKPASASFASVQIRGHTPEQIRAATVVVFEQDGYAATDIRRPELVFEKEGSQWDKIAYGSFGDDAAIWIRVKVSVVPLSPELCRLQCQAYRVRNRGDAVFEDQVQLRHNKSKPYQALLDKVLGQVNR